MRRFATGRLPTPKLVQTATDIEGMSFSLSAAPAVGSALLFSYRNNDYVDTAGLHSALGGVEFFTVSPGQIGGHLFSVGVKTSASADVSISGTTQDSWGSTMCSEWDMRGAPWPEVWHPVDIFPSQTSTDYTLSYTPDRQPLDRWAYAFFCFGGVSMTSRPASMWTTLRARGCPTVWTSFANIAHGIAVVPPGVLPIWDIVVDATTYPVNGTVGMAYK